MTPAAAFTFQHTDSDEVRSLLASAQFFECSALTTMAREMVLADVRAGCHEFSLMAQLPAPVTVIEFMKDGARVMVIAKQRENHIRWSLFVRDHGGVYWVTTAGFHLGSTLNDASYWDQEYLMEACARSGRDQLEYSSTNTKATNGELEKILCIINQPGLVDQRERPAHKKVMRLGDKLHLTPKIAQTWRECRIRPGEHGKPAEVSAGAPRQLHYVRKHWKPSVGKWIDGYWRGNADLGVHLKWYNTSDLARSTAA